MQPSARPEHVEFFVVQAGRITGSTDFSISPAEHSKSQSMESRIAQALQAIPTPETPTSATELEEHLAILKRWYYRSNRTGELFLADHKDNLPMRRLVRGVGRVFRGEKIVEGEPAANQVGPTPEAGSPST